ncbi:MAG: uracil phosphoribosyltransferase [Chloroflexi bacterium]|nr:MAG: uracil phosphoribosyltransferase [Chloroflexota bacterium]MBL1196203.1 uracil phosphoribosyltransferase [Chloroflexota bacterium]NOH13496.1 uracil phosphoribosyltransferase [Chloroflexota bacterium]
MSNVFVSEHPLVKHKITALRDEKTDHLQFRNLVREISTLLTYEATQDLKTKAKTVMSPMGEAAGHTLEDAVGLVPILRAGLGMVEGVWGLMPAAQVWHIGLYRDEETLQPVQYYNKLPSEPTVSMVFVLDPMLATGGSAVATIDIVKKWGITRIKYVGILGAPEGVEEMQKHHADVPIYLGVLDSHLNDIGYIVPGLGDAGDRQFGTA